MSVVVDTDVVSFHLKGDSRMESYVPALAGQHLVISFMTLAELRLWTLVRNWGPDRRRDMIAEIRSRYVIHSANQELCRVWAELKAAARKQGRVLETADAWIAATAVSQEIPLVTHNRRDFDFLPGLEVVSFAPQ